MTDETPAGAPTAEQTPAGSQPADTKPAEGETEVKSGPTYEITQNVKATTPAGSFDHQIGDRIVAEGEALLAHLENLVRLGHAKRLDPAGGQTETEPTTAPAAETPLVGGQASPTEAPKVENLVQPSTAAQPTPAEGTDAGSTAS